MKKDSCLHKAVFAPAGCLMSFDSKVLLFRELFEKGAHVVIVDPEGEYTNLKEAFGFEDYTVSTEKER